QQHNGPQMDPVARAKFTRLLLEKEADVNCQDEYGRTSLSLACELGHLDVVKLLVQFNANPDVSDAWGNSALMYAAYTGHSHVLEFLVRAFKRMGMRLDRTNQAGHSAIQVANFFGHDQCVQALNSGRRGVVNTHILQFKRSVETQWKGWLRQTLKQHPGEHTHTFKIK
uniref:Uncharacterized protein n=1 Tax=Hucho hucho TaxID=62062 RepID=A0A4W5PTC0_9TELE